MPAKLIPHLRYLNHPLQGIRLPFMSMRSWLANPLRTHGSTPFRTFGATHANSHTGVRRHSSKSFRSKEGSRSGGFGRERAQVSKSLMEDEEELSDWVSDLRTSSLRGGQGTSDEEGDNRSRGRRVGNRKEKFEGRGWENVGKGFAGGNKRDAQYFQRSATKRNREFDDEYATGRERDGRKTKPYGREFGGERSGSRFSGNKRNSLNGEFNTQRNSDSRRSNNAPKDNRSRNFGAAKKDSGRGNFKPFENSRKRITIAESEDDSPDEDEDQEVENDAEFDRLESDLGNFLRDSESDDEDDDAVDDKSDAEENSSETLARSSLGLKDDNFQNSKELTGSSGSYLGKTRFDQCSISPLSLKALKFVGFDTMTIVQEATLPAILKGKDVLAKAKTGTGKTIAFLLPSIEVIAKAPPVGNDQKRPPILVLVVCPTRELATQAAGEAKILLKFHTFIGVQVVMGGTRLSLEQKKLQANPCQILVATPGRLRDHLENTPGFATRLMGVKVLVLDEADHLLDMGFRKDIENIIAAVPKQRQTLCFSATIPDEVRHICHLALKRDHEFINTVQEGSEDTHAQVRQAYMIAPMEKQFPVLYTILKDHVADNIDYKVLVFCTTAMLTHLVASLCGELHLNVREIHSRKAQNYRTRVSNEFRNSKGLILVTSDVSARGVDYPDVTLVVQMGLPADREQYIHRLGRTGRRGKEGEGILLLAPWEEFFLSSIKDLPISKGSLPVVDPDVAKKVQKSLSLVQVKSKESAYQAWLGYYNSNKVVGKDKYKLVELANEFSRCMGLDSPPALPKLVVGKMGLKNIPGLRTK